MFFYSRFQQTLHARVPNHIPKLTSRRGNFVITFRSSEAISELRFQIRKFKLRVYQETSKMSCENKFRTGMQIKCNFICIRVLNLFSFNVLQITVDSPSSRWFRKESIQFSNSSSGFFSDIFDVSW